MYEVKTFKKLGQRTSSRSQGKKCWYPPKSLVTKNTCVKYYNPNNYSHKDTVKVKVFNKQVKHKGQGHKIKSFGTKGRSSYNTHSLDISKS
jgi:hypothetical protein